METQVGDIVDILLPVNLLSNGNINYNSPNLLWLFRSGYLPLDNTISYYSSSYRALLNANFISGNSTFFNLYDLRGGFARTVTSGNTIPSYQTRPSDPKPGTIGSFADWRYPLHDHVTNFNGGFDLTNYTQHVHNTVMNGTPESKPFNASGGTPYVPLAGFSTTETATLVNSPEIYSITLNFNQNVSIPPNVTWMANYAPLIPDTSSAYYSPYLGAMNADEYAPPSAILLKCIRFI